MSCNNFGVGHVVGVGRVICVCRVAGAGRVSSVNRVICISRVVGVVARFWSS